MLRVAPIGLAAVLVVGGSACGGSSEEEAAPRASTSSSPAGADDYVTAINAIWAEHLPLVLKATGGGHPDHYPIATYQAEAPQMEALRTQFDAKVSAVAVPPDAREAAATLDAYRKGSDEAEARLAAAAATGDQRKYDSAYDLNLSTSTGDRAQMRAAGFSRQCNAR